MNSLKHEDHCTLVHNLEDLDILTRKGFDVNLRLYKSSEGYRKAVQACAEHIKWCATTLKEGYKKPHGYSGANAGIPLNIIALANGTVMLNPKVLSNSGSVISTSNCGSLRLASPIAIKRYARIEFEYFDLDLNRHTAIGYYPTVQHEIDHNNGVLITQRRVEDGEVPRVRK